MVKSIVAQLSELVGSNEEETISQIEKLLTAISGASLTVGVARDTFTKMIARAREGDVQLIGRKTEDMVVMISLKDLSVLLNSSSASLSLGSALDEVGFEPLGRRITIARRNEQPALRRQVD